MSIPSVFNRIAHSQGGVKPGRNELERTPGMAAVSGTYGREPAGLQTPAGFPWTNPELLIIDGELSY